ncbi:MAG: glycosidase [Planctomycetes bacterium]|nr:glycosidase [Planctomycetota bacterium]
MARVTRESPQELLARHPQNPLLTRADWPYAANAVFNAGATRLASGETLLLCRVEDRTGLSHLCAARSQDGISDWTVDPAPTLEADPTHHPEETWGIEDPRVVWVEELDRYVITFTSYSIAGPGVSLATTKDFVTFERQGVAIPPDNKDAAVFPERINGRWAMIHRPMPASAGNRGNIWISYSPDLKHWGDHKQILAARDGAWWDAGKIGLSPPPIKTDEGWLLLYHGVRMTPAGCIYRLGAALMDLEHPDRLIRRGDEWIFGPQEEYERVGDVGDVVFPCGVTVNADTKELRLYYGAADTTIALAIANLDEIVGYLLNSGN